MLPSNHLQHGKLGIARPSLDQVGVEEWLRIAVRGDIKPPATGLGQYPYAISEK
jgi:hypothetical protein